MTSNCVSFEPNRSTDTPCSQAEAPAQVIDTITAAEGLKSNSKNGPKAVEPSPPNSQHSETLSPEHRQELEMLQELIKRKLQSGKS